MKTSSRAAVGVCALLFLEIAGQGSVVYRTASGAPQRWNLTPPFNPVLPATSFNPVTGRIRYYLAADGWSTTNTVAELNAARAAFAQWQLIPGTSLRFEEGGTTSAGVDVNTADGTNVVYWAKTSLFVNGGRDHIGGAMGVTYTRLEGEAMAEADTVLNGVQQRWFTDPSRVDAAAQFAEGIILHEIGHWLGLAHSPVGAATLFARGDSGVNLQAGLGSDEACAVRALYPDAMQSGSWGGIRGRVTRSGSPVFGAMVFAEDAASGVVAGTVTEADGSFALGGLPPGVLGVRVAPLDAGGLDYLVRGIDIGIPWSAGDGAFAATPPQEVTVVAGGIAVLDVTVSGPRPDFWIGYLRVPTSLASSFAGVDGPVSVKPGQSGQYVGVYSRNLPTNGVELSVTGSGLLVGPTLVSSDPVPGTGLRALSVLVEVATNAAPGPRTLVVRRLNDGAVAVAPGFLSVEPVVSDWNLDGLDDSFQRRWFPLFTAPEAAPLADPDADGVRNREEAIAGTNPTNALSYLRMEPLSVGAGGTTVTWSSVRLKRYQVWRRTGWVDGTWAAVGVPIRATNSVAGLIDPGTDARRFYRVEVLP